MNPLIAEELRRIPRGDFAQNPYRSTYVDARQNALGSRPEIGPDPAEAHGIALKTVRTQHPDFIPTFLG